MYFKDKIVWITGASSGIGEALTYAFNNSDAKVIISARRRNELERVKASCKNNSNENIFILELDLTDIQSFEQKTKIVLEKFGRIDILVNNGGVSQRALVKDTDYSVIKRIMDINFFGTAMLTKSVLPNMIAQKSGNIVVMSSLAGKFGTQKRSAYAAAKHALQGFFECLRMEVYDDNIKILTVNPGYIKTDISINALTGDGTPQNSMDKGQENGMLPDVLAQKILKAVRKGKRELIVGGIEKLPVYIKKFFPNLFFKILRNK